MRRVENRAIDSRSGQAGRGHAAARLPAPGGLEGQAEQGMSIRAIQDSGTGYEKREVCVSRGEAGGRSLIGQDFNSCVACDHLGPVVFFHAAPGLSRGQRQSGGRGRRCNRLEPEDLGLRWKEGVKSMKSYRTCLTLPPPNGEECVLPGNPRLE